MKLTQEQKNELVTKLFEAKAIAEALLLSIRQVEPTSGLVDMYMKTAEAIDRRVLAIQNPDSLVSAPMNSPPSLLGLYRGVSEWCEEDELLDKIVEIEDFFVAIQK